MLLLDVVTDIACFVVLVYAAVITVLCSKSTRQPPVPIIKENNTAASHYFRHPIVIDGLIGTQLRLVHVNEGNGTNPVVSSSLFSCETTCFMGSRPPPPAASAAQEKVSEGVAAAGLAKECNCSRSTADVADGDENGNGGDNASDEKSTGCDWEVKDFIRFHPVDWLGDAHLRLPLGYLSGGRAAAHACRKEREEATRILLGEGKWSDGEERERFMEDVETEIIQAARRKDDEDYIRRHGQEAFDEREKKYNKKKYGIEGSQKGWFGQLTESFWGSGQLSFLFQTSLVHARSLVETQRRVQSTIVLHSPRCRSRSQLHGSTNATANDINTDKNGGNDGADERGCRWEWSDFVRWND
ncbi:hypothetical protein IWZ03DRAFT_435198 [Phyllosticta citriasiana]|uniref:Uncharacterized protein n=1 Tax=Phyllosticta citriasiana TaxID=595635 RepID=A0ABR1KUG2_9PEZI